MTRRLLLEVCKVCYLPPVKTSDSEAGFVNFLVLFGVQLEGNSPWGWQPPRRAKEKWDL